MKILITGGAGFIGSHLVDKVIENGYEAYVIDNLLTGNQILINKKAKFYQLDIRSTKLKDIFEEVKPEVVFHLAAQIDVQKSLHSPFLDAEINILGTLNVLELCKSYHCKLIYSSSAAVYGTPEYLPVDEEHPIYPLSNYGISKFTPEMYIKAFSKMYNLEFTILRYGNVYGSRQEAKGEGGVIPIFLEKMINNESPIIFGNGEQTRDFIYVEDVVSANIASITRGNRGTYNISRNERISINDLIYEINLLLSKNMVPIYRSPRTGDIIHSLLDNQLAKKELQWEPIFSIRDGLRKTYDPTLKNKF